MSERELSKYSLSRFGDYALKVFHKSYKHNGVEKTLYKYYPPDFYIEIPCGTCYECLKRKTNEWRIRLLFEVDAYKQNAFVTLTFTDEYLERFKDKPKEALKLYIDRLRKSLGYRPRYWFISELGDEEKYSGRLHFHGIFFGTSRESLSYALIREKWPYGVSWVGWCAPKTATYITKYLLKFQGDYKPVIMCSNGIGACYLKSRKDLEYYHTNNFEPRMYIERNGRTYPMSMYYKRKIFSEDTLFCLSMSRLTSYIPFIKKVKGRIYYDNDTYLYARKSYYQYTLDIGLSQPLKTKLNYATLCISQSRPTEG